MRNARRIVAAGLVVLAASALAWAGAQARLLGTVKSSAGAPIPDAVITITTDEVASFLQQIEVKPDGSFTYLLLDATRHYKFRVEAPGHIPYEQMVKVPAGSTDNEFAFVLKTEQEVRQGEQDRILQQPGYKELGEGAELIKQGRKAEAEAKLEEAVRAMPELTPAWTSLGQLAWDREDYPKAMERARRCLELDDESLPCLALAVNASERLGDPAAHQQFLDRYQELNPSDPAALFNQAAAFINANPPDDAKARPLLEKCLEADPAFPKCLFEFGMLLLRSGDMEGAKAKLQRYLEVAPEGEDAAAARDTIKYL